MMTDDPEIERLAERWGAPFHDEMILEASPEFFNPWGGGWQHRRGEVLFVLPRSGGLLLHRKADYPRTAWRFPTGGIDDGERIEAALWRELDEEIGLPLTVQRYLALIRYEVRLGAQRYRFATHCFLMAHSAEPLRGSDPAECFDSRVVSLDALPEAALALESLDPPWHEWGLFRARAHRLVSKLGWACV